MLATAEWVTFAGWAFGLVMGLAAVAGYLTGSVRKSVADARDKDIDALTRHGELLDTQILELQAAVKACEERDRAKEQTIANLSSQIKSGVELIAVAKQVAERLDRLEGSK